MAETVNQGTGSAQAAAAPQGTGTQSERAAEGTRSFTQAEMDAIIGDRLARERAKYADYEELRKKAGLYDAQLEAGKTDLQKAQEQAESYKAQLEALQKETAAQTARAKVSAELGVPVTLLTGETEETCRTQAQEMLSWRGDRPNYPAIGDGGEVTRGSGGKTRDQFADWFKSLK